MGYDDDDDDIPPFQWIFHVETFHYLSHIYIKEFCGYCIQTNQVILHHVKMPSSFATDLRDWDPLHMVTFAIQSKRHGFSLDDGDISVKDFANDLKSKVAKDCTIYTLSLGVQNYFTKQFLYPKVINLRTYLPLKYKEIMKQLPTKACFKNHSKIHCAQKKVCEVANFLKPALVPFLQSSLIFKQCSKCDLFDSEQVKFGRHHLKPPLYQSLTSVDLVKLCDAAAEN